MNTQLSEVTPSEWEAQFRGRLKPARCPGCGGEAQSLPFGTKVITVCDTCAAKEQRQRTEDERRTRVLTQWRTITPPEMRRELDLSLMHTVIAAAARSDLLLGSALIGGTGSGKTRMGFWLLRKAAETGRSVYAVSHGAFRRAASELHSRDPKIADASRELLAAAKHAQALLIDDIGKGAPTETADEAFFELLDWRLSNRLLTHWTANSGSRWLEKRFGQDKGPAIIRRLRDLTTGQVWLAEGQ